ncbi:hypothetical protein [Lysinibacillus sp. BPa_S21]|uniref:hypothetical protein n=1 Tax=Lysinibacillus sp. BPa_S21 TaxID=2932478 RepID=UPI0020128759|nr:hypothetical protein [Lysinibacillus sp. BPa_S21]MCL1695197.1 hypothetical protein [Lysinibacillus sp. BPa_S21]
MGISGRGTKAKNITSCGNAFVTNLGAVAVAALSHKQNPLLPLRFRAINICWPETLQRSGCFLCESVVLTQRQQQKRLIGRPQEALLCAKAKRQRQMFSVAKAKRQLQMFYLCESEATATKRSAGTEINYTFWW